VYKTKAPFPTGQVPNVTLRIWMGSVESLHEVLSEKENPPLGPEVTSRYPNWLDLVIAPGGASDRKVIGKLVVPTV